MLKLCGIAGIGIGGMLATVDVDYYTSTLTGWGKLLGAVVVVAGTSYTIWLRGVKPVVDRCVKAVNEKIFDPIARSEASGIETQRQIGEIVAGNEHRTELIKGIMAQGQLTDRKVDVLAIKVAATERDSHIPKVWCDPTGEIVDVTQGWEKMFCLDRHAARDKGWKQRIYAPERDRVDTTWTKVASAGHHDVMGFHIYSDATDRMIQAVESDIQALKLNDPGRTLVGYCCVLKTIGEPMPIASMP